MSKKMIRNCMLVIAICCLILGGIFKSTAKKQQGTRATAGIIVNGEFKATESGTIGANRGKYEMFNTGGTVFYILAGITGIAGVLMLVNEKKK